MSFKKTAILTSPTSWFFPYAVEFVNDMNRSGFFCKLFSRHEDISEEYEVVFILSYFRIIEEVYLKKHKHNLVVHESNLPQGKGWAPLFWQILEGKNQIPIVLFEAETGVDSGKIFLKDEIVLEGHELYGEIREKQATASFDLCKKFLKEYSSLQSYYPNGKESFYAKRCPQDSELDINKTIKDQFNLLRIVNNEEFPAFFILNGRKYIIKIDKDADTK